MRTLFVIPARGGSKGIPRKNIRNLGGKPLLHYSIEIARSMADDKDICVTTDDHEIRAVAEETGLCVPFLRPQELATDQSGTYEVLLHAINYYASLNVEYDLLVLLQPTSPFRYLGQIQEALKLWETGLEMIVSVKVAKSNPYYNLFEENKEGYLRQSKEGKFKQRQECPTVYEYNGSIYIIDIQSLKQRTLSEFKKVKKYVMDDLTSLDLDNILDWEFAEFLLAKGMYAKENITGR